MELCRGSIRIMEKKMETIGIIGIMWYEGLKLAWRVMET